MTVHNDVKTALFISVNDNKCDWTPTSCRAARDISEKRTNTTLSTPRHRVAHFLEFLTDMVGSGQSSSSIARKVFTMTPEEENYRTKLQRTDSPDVSSAIPLFVPSFSKPASSVFSFTATKNEQAQVGVRTGHLKSTMRCRVCKRPNVMMRSSTAESNTLAGKLWPLSRDDISFSINSVNFKQQEPSRLLVHSTANSSSIYGIQPQRITTTAGSMTSLGCPNLITTSMVQSDDKNYPDKKLEDADQIVKEASELVKLLESRIAALQLSAQALKTPSERKMQASPMNSYLNPKTEEAVNNPFKQTKKHKLVETSMPPRPPLHQSIRAAYSCGQQSPNLLNLSPVITFPQQAPSPAPSLSYTPSQIQYVAPCQTRASNRRQSLAPSLSYTPNQIQCNAPCQSRASNRSQEQSSVKSYKLSSIPNQKQNSTPVLNVKNIVQRLESLNMSPNQNKLEKAHIRRRTRAGGAGSVASTSSGVNRPSKPSKPSNTPSQSRAAYLTRKVKNPKSKLISSHKIPPRQHSSDYSDDSGSSVSSSSSSSWTTTQQSGSESVPEESNEYSYSSSASLPSQAESYATPESEYSTEASSSSATSQSQSQSQRQTSRRRRISRPRSFNRRLRKDRSPSPISRLRRIKNKLGLIFHHHHHHHHHDVEKPKSLWKKVNQKTVVRQPHEAAVKKANESVVKRRDQQGHFHALIDGLMRHVRRQRKKKKKTTPLKNVGRQKKTVVQWGKVVKHRRKLKLPNINKNI